MAERQISGVRESREVRNERLTRQTVVYLSDIHGIDGYAADAVVRAVARDSKHPWAKDVLRAGLRGVWVSGGGDVGMSRISAAFQRASRAVAVFSAEMATTYAEMDDEFRQHPDMAELDDFLRRHYGAD